jgi:putative flippase GtrA
MMDLNDEQDVDTEKSHRGPLATAVKWLESRTLPMILSRNKEVPTPIITGLERVLFGTQAAADVVAIVGVRPPRYLCYMASGFICDIIQFCIDLILHLALHLNDPSLCWALGFGISVSFRHTTHRYLVFGNYVGGYWASLGRMYAGYSIIIVLSTVFNLFMTRSAKLPHYVAWMVTLLWTGIANYFILKKLWVFGGKQKTDADAPAAVEDPESQQSPLKDRSKGNA